MGSFGKFRKAGAGGDASVAGSNTQIQFNADGILGADSGLTFTASTDELDVGYIQLKGEQGSTPAQPPDGEGGYIYSKADGKIYWRSNELGETDLTAGASTAAGSDTYLQYNNGGAFGGAANLVYNDSSGYLGVGASGGALTHRLTLPNTDGAGGRVKANAYVTYSSKRYKDTIQKIEKPLDILDKLNGVTYQWKDSGRTDIGFIAEDVGKILPCVVDYEKNGVDAIAMDYTRINAVLVEAVKEQSKTISSQKKQLDKLTDLLEVLTNSQKDKLESLKTFLKR